MAKLLGGSQFTPKALEEFVAGAPAPGTLPLRPQAGAALKQPIGAPAPDAKLIQTRGLDFMPGQEKWDEITWGDETGLSGPELYQHRLETIQRKQAQEYAKAVADDKAQAAALYQESLGKKQELDRLQTIHDEDAAARSKPGTGWIQDRVTPEQLAAAQTAYQDAFSRFGAHQTEGPRTLKALQEKQAKLYQGAGATVRDMIESRDFNTRVGAENTTNKKNYDERLSGWTNADKEYQDFVRQRDEFTTKRDALSADVAAGKYNVDPYRFIQQGASLQEIMELRAQLNAGRKNPTMRVPTLKGPDKEVQAPGERPGDYVPIAERQLAKIDDDVATALGYKPPAASQQETFGSNGFGVDRNPPPDPASHAPAPPPAPAAPAPVQPAPAAAPAPKPVLAEAKPQPVQPLTTQMTSQQSSQPTQQTVTQPVQKQEPINKATSLAQQTTGTVAGQGASSESAKPAPQPTPQNVAAPKPFKQSFKQDDEDNVWEI